MKKILFIPFLLYMLAFAHSAVAQQFTVPFTVTDGNASQVLTVGIHPDGDVDEVLGLDVASPPAAPGGFDARILGSANDNTDFFSKYQANTLTEKAFVFEYRSGDDDGPIVFTWDNSALAELGTFTIVDNINGTFFNANLLDYNGEFAPVSADPTFLSESLGFTLLVTPFPVPPALIFPANGAIDVVLPVTLEWNTADNADEYAIQIDLAGGDFSSPVFTTTTSATSIAAAGLNPGIAYQWRVQTQADPDFESAWSEVWSFTTEAGPPALGVPVLAFPTNAAVDVEIPVTLQWGAVDDAVGYQIQLSPAGIGFDDPVFFADFSFDTQIEVSVLDALSEYEWRVRATDADADTGDWSEVWSFTTEEDDDPAELDPPTLTSPANGAVDIAIDPTLFWDVVAGADSYLIQLVLAGESFDDPIIDEIITSGEYDAILNHLTEYEWRVQALADPDIESDWSTVWSFTTEAGPPVLGVPVLTFPTNAAVDVEIPVTLQWGAVDDAVGYQIQLSPVGIGFDDPVFFADFSFDTQIEVSVLDALSEYEWRVRATDAGGDTGDWSEVWSFTTDADPLELDAPVLSGPANGATDVEHPVSLEWETVDGAGEYVVQVTIAVDSFDEAVLDVSTTETDISVPGLFDNTEYKWRVMAVAGSVESDWSEVWNFTTDVDMLDPPATPGLASPSDGATDVSTSPTLAWDASAGAESYSLEVATDDDFTTLVVNVNGTAATTYPASGLDYTTTYYWRVIAHNTAGDSDWSDEWNFTTMDEPLVEPDTPTLASPADGATSVSTSPTLAWDAAAGTENYSLEVSTDDDFTTLVIDESDLTGTSYNALGLDYNTGYYWRVMAHNTAGDSDWSDEWSFTTMDEPLSAPDAPGLVSPADESTDVSINPTLAWNASTGAEDYSVQLATDSDFSTLVLDQSNITGTSFDAALDVTTTYYWRVMAHNTVGDSPWSDEWSFTTEGNDGRILASNQSEYIFLDEDFGVMNSTFSVKIESLPGQGMLMLDENAVNAGDQIAIADINNGQLTWSHISNTDHGYGFSSFGFRIMNESGIEGGNVYAMNIDLAAAAVPLLFDGEGWRFMTSPAQGETFASLLEPLWTQGIAGSDNPVASLPNIYRFDQENYQWQVPGHLNEEIGMGEAFIMYVFSDDNFNGTPDGFPKILTSMEQWLPLNGEFEFSDLGYDPDQGEDGDSHFLVANPHPVSVDFCEFESEDVNPYVVVWDPASGDGDYLTLVCGLDDVHIAPFQAFWVQTTDVNPTLTIPEGAYLSSSADGYFKQIIAGTEENPNLAAIAGLAPDFSPLSLYVQSLDGKYSNRVTILFHEGNTLFDAPKLSPAGLAKNWLSFYSLDEGGRGYALRSIDKDFSDQVSIPMDIQTTREGFFEMTWQLPEFCTQCAGPGNYSYSIRDNLTGQVAELKTGNRYRFEVTETAESTTFFKGLNGIDQVTIQNPASSEPRFHLLVTAGGEMGVHGDLPSTISLSQNYPNPFNPSTVIHFEMPQAGEVHLAVFDMLGRHVATIMEGGVTEGRHQVTFDASGLTSGVYLYRLQTASSVHTRKLTVIK